MENVQQRKPNRLKGYDYSQPGIYFVTVCVHERFENRNIFGVIHQGEMMNNQHADIVANCWNDIPSHYLHVTLDGFVVMPDHFHGIVWIKNTIGNRHEGNGPVGNRHACSLRERRQNQILPNVIGSFKSAVSKEIRKKDFPGFQWQKSYYDHVIRNDESLMKIREYIQNNPKKWGLDHDVNEAREIMRIMGHAGERSNVRNGMKEMGL
ncbi:MAG: transposase [Proteobacteria bacterium]|nr:transposase [Pseudomonadota bacterium]MBU4470335.1 transposase [Pseudomonadota bacterium]MCG2752746.1 transposase [Desulfobacteraceae bacterium]